MWFRNVVFLDQEDELVILTISIKPSHHYDGNFQGRKKKKPSDKIRVIDIQWFIYNEKWYIKTSLNSLFDREFKTIIEQYLQVLFKTNVI